MTGEDDARRQHPSNQGQPEKSNEWPLSLAVLLSSPFLAPLFMVVINDYTTHSPSFFVTWRMIAFPAILSLFIGLIVRAWRLDRE
ncbi:MAG: hypothetical protein AB7O86_05645 [Porticoccaceae bacterium]